MSSTYEVTGPVTADLEETAAEDGAVHGIVGNQGDQRTFPAFESNNANLPVHRPVGIEAQRNRAVKVPSAAVDVGARHADAHGDPGRRQLRAGLLYAGDQGGFDELQVIAVPGVLGPAFEEDIIDTGWADFGSRVRVGDAPPYLALVEADFLFQLGGHLVVNGGRKDAEVGGDQEDLRKPVVQGSDAVEDRVMDSGRLASTIAHKPLRGFRSDVNLDGCGTEVGLSCDCCEDEC